MKRSKHQLWRNGKGCLWTCRIIWYGCGKNCWEHIRLECQCPYGEMNKFPMSKDDADKIWETFRKLAGDGDMDALWSWMIS